MLGRRGYSVAPKPPTSRAAGAVLTLRLLGQVATILTARNLDCQTCPHARHLGWHGRPRSHRQKRNTLADRETLNPRKKEYSR
jgi:hypothetical protein